MTIPGCVLLTAILSTADASSCQAINDNFCVSWGYNGNATFPNVFNQTEGAARVGMGAVFYLSFLQCSSRINQFLCSAFYPTCNPFSPAPIEPCLEFCVQVRDECLPLLSSYTLPWPSTLDCDIHFIPFNQNPVCSWVQPTGQSTLPSNQSNSSNCTYLVPATQMAAEETFVLAWVATGTAVYTCTTAIMLLYLICARTSDSIEWSVISIASCYGFASIAYCVSVVTIARNPPTCISSNHPPAYKEDSLCTATFGIVYYCTCCSWTWWTVLIFQWLARGLDMKFSRQKRTLVLYHLFCWLVPAPIVAASMALKDLALDPVVGVCSFKKESLFAFVIVPLFVTLVTCCLLTLLAQVLLLRHKVRVKAKPEKGRDGRVLRAGLYIPMCFVVQGSLLMLYSYEYWYHAPLTSTAATAHIMLQVNIAKFTVTMVINIMTVAWVTTRSSCSCCHHSTTTLDFLNCDLPTLPHTDAVRSIKETSV